MAKKAKKNIKPGANKKAKPTKTAGKGGVKKTTDAKKNISRPAPGKKKIALKKPVKTAAKVIPGKKQAAPKKETGKKPAIAKKAEKQIKKPALNIKKIEAKKPLKDNVNNKSKIELKPGKDLKSVPKGIANPKTSKSKSGLPKPPRLIVEKIVKELDIPLKILKKEPPGKFEIEYVVHTSPGILYEFLTTPSGLSEWFADDVNVKEDKYTFFWDGSKQEARVLGAKDQKYIRFQWADRNDGSYFEFRIEVDELTNDVSFIITDFADGAEISTSKLLWNSQVNKLLHVIGAYF